MQADIIKQLIETGLKGAKVHVEGDGTHFEAWVISEEFHNLTRLKKQQLVYNTVRTQLLDGTIHALSVKTFTPEEWQQIDPEEQGSN